MNLEVESYTASKNRLPRTGRQIIAQRSGDNMVVYQAYQPAIANYAVANQHFGGSAYSYERMSWIKPGFLWMMYRSGWAQKEGQERILAIWISELHFKTILSEAVLSTYNVTVHSSQLAWKQAMKARDVRLQWDPDHGPHGNKMERRAVQLGLKGNMLEQFGKNYVQRIEDITDFVNEQKASLNKFGPDALQVPVEQVIPIDDPQVRANVNISAL